MTDTQVTWLLLIAMVILTGLSAYLGVRLYRFALTSRKLLPARRRRKLFEESKEAVAEADRMLRLQRVRRSRSSEPSVASAGRCDSKGLKTASEEPWERAQRIIVDWPMGQDARRDRSDELEVPEDRQPYGIESTDEASDDLRRKSRTQGWVYKDKVGSV